MSDNTLRAELEALADRYTVAAEHLNRVDGWGKRAVYLRARDDLRALLAAHPVEARDGEHVENGESGDTWAYVVPDGPKMLRETLSVAQHRLHSVEDARNVEHSKRLGRLIDECERHRPTDNACKHGNLHTPTCGCEDKPYRALGSTGAKGVDRGHV